MEQMNCNKKGVKCVFCTMKLEEKGRRNTFIGIEYAIYPAKYIAYRTHTYLHNYLLFARKPDYVSNFF